mmetsp:Transcript_8629/g.19609  ORF Transcript_8629/g.19609 Transcript_8629/m.19609 type:complete len:211 (+) Transcript_8629:376-1008(+)
MFPTPNTSSTIPRTPRSTQSPYEMYGSTPGTTGTRSTRVSKSKRGVYGASWNDAGSSIASPHTISTPSIARGATPGLSNAVYELACTFCVRFPLRSLPSKHTQTSGARSSTGFVAQLTLSIKFMRASVRGAPRGSCDPVMTMGFPNPTSMSESALAVNAIVSVPCTRMNASYSSLLASSSSAIVTQWSGPTFELSSLKRTYRSRSAKVVI